MFSTLNNITSVMPKSHNGSVVGKFITYPDFTGKRISEGGLRINGKFKSSLPEIPLVTIITVTLNAETTLAQCIISVLNQSYKNIEYIIIDGGSSDGTLNIIKKYQDIVDYFVSEPDRGLYHAMNKGLELATGDYILTLNADDWYVKGCVIGLINAKKYSGVDFVSALAQYVDQEGKPLYVLRSMPFDDSLRLRMPLRHGCMLISSVIYNDIGPYDESYKIIADFDLTVRIFEKKYTHYELPRPLLFFRNTGVSNRRLDRLFSERKRLNQNLFPFLDSNEVSLFGELAKLSPSELEQLCIKYSHNYKFLNSLECYYENMRQKPKAVRWKNYEIDWKRIKQQNKLPKVSVILPIYNAESTLQECLDSILAQTLKNFELICVNDASPDNCQKIVDKYMSLDSRVISVSNKINVGLGSSRNRGIQLARGGYIFHIDPDDVIPPNSLEILYDYAIKYGSDMIKGAYRSEQILFGESPQKPQIKNLLNGADHIVNTSLKQMPDLLKTTEGHWSYLYKAGLAKRVPYPVDLKMGQDSMFIVSVLVQVRSVSIIDEVVYRYRVNPASAMNTWNFKKYLDALEWRRRAWHMLKNVGMETIGSRLLQVYWGDEFFKSLAKSLTIKQLNEFFCRFCQAYAEAGIKVLTYKPTKFLSHLFTLILENKDHQARVFMTRGENFQNKPNKT